MGLKEEGKMGEVERKLSYEERIIRNLCAAILLLFAFSVLICAVQFAAAG
jgi:hypothetical protein